MGCFVFGLVNTEMASHAEVSAETLVAGR